MERQETPNSLRISLRSVRNGGDQGRTMHVLPGKYLCTITVAKTMNGGKLTTAPAAQQRDVRNVNKVLDAKG